MLQKGPTLKSPRSDLGRYQEVGLPPFTLNTFLISINLPALADNLTIAHGDSALTELGHLRVVGHDDKGLALFV